MPTRTSSAFPEAGRSAIGSSCTRARRAYFGPFRRFVRRRCMPGRPQTLSTGTSVCSVFGHGFSDGATSYGNGSHNAWTQTVLSSCWSSAWPGASHQLVATSIGPRA